MKRKTLGQIAFEAQGAEPGRWEALHDAERQSYQIEAIAVAKEVLRRVRRLDWVGPVVINLSDVK